MAEEEAKEVPKKKAKKERIESVKAYQQDIAAEKQKMGSYSRTFGKSVKSLQANFKKHAKDMEEAASNMKEEGIKSMNAKVGKFKGEIKDQIKENKEAVSHMEDNVKYLLSEINKKKKDFQAYTNGPFNNYIKAFWG